MLKDASEEECRAIGGILGKSLEPGEIRFSFSDFVQGLQKTRFAPVDMKQVLDFYFGEVLATHQEEKRAEQERKESFLKRQQELFRDRWGASFPGAFWLKAMADSQKYGYQLLMKEFGREEGQAELLLLSVGRAMAALGGCGELCGRETAALDGCGAACDWALAALEERRENARYPLAVFAADITGNPHFFDRGTAAGQLLIYAISYWKNREVPANAHQWRELLTLVGIVPDNVSSIVHAYGLRLRTADGYHPAYDAFLERKEPCAITMENLAHITGVRVAGDRAYVVENEMVFSYLLDRVREKNITLLCTSGQFRTAALELFPLLIASGARICYSGDMDPEGMDMADRLWQKYGDSVQIWRMQPDDYEKSVSEEHLDGVRLAKLEHLQNSLLKETAECIREKKLAAYQENLLEDLLGDIL